MTETNSKNFQQWTADGETTIFSPSNINVQNETDLAVYIDDALQIITTDYTVGIVAQVATVTFVTAPANGERVSIVREEPLEQNTDLTTINTFRAEGFEAALDSFARQLFRLWHKLTRSLTLPDSHVDGSGRFDARFNRIGNVGDPAADQDAVTKAYAENRYALQSAGGGDMFKASYDTDADGKVNSADAADAVPWSGIISKPSVFTPDAHTHIGADISDLAPVATSGDYGDLSGRPTLPVIDDSAYGTGWNGNTDAPTKNTVYDKIEALVLGGGSGDMAKAIYDTNDDGKVDAANSADAAPWSGLTGVPATFTPSSHTHTAADVTDFGPEADARLSAAIGVSVQGFDTATAKTDIAQIFSALQACSVETLVDGATITPTGTKHLNQVMLAGDRTMANPTSIIAGATYLFKITQDGTGSRTLVWGPAYKFPGGTPPTLTEDAGGTDILSGISFDGTSIQIFTPGKDFR